MRTLVSRGLLAIALLAGALLAAATPASADNGPFGCEAFWAGTSYQAQFTEAAPLSFLRIDGRFVAEVTGQGSFEGTSQGPRDTLLVRVRLPAGQFVDVPCAERDPNPTPPPTPAPPELGCSATRINGSAVLRFDDVGTSAQIRRDGRWFRSVTAEESLLVRASSFPFDGVGEFELVRFIDGERLVFPCVEDTTTPTCLTDFVRRDDQSVRVGVFWANLPNEIVVLRTLDRWVVTPPAGADSYLDVDFRFPFRSEVVLRNRVDGGGFTDFVCSTS